MKLLLEEGLKQHPELDTDKSGALSWGSRYLHDAANNGWSVLVKLLVENHINVNSIDTNLDNMTPLCLAAEKGYVDIVEFLLDHGAAPDYQTKPKDTPLTLAVRRGREEVVKVLLDRNANATLQNIYEEAPMVLAESFPTILSMLAKRDKDGQLAVSAAELSPIVDQEFKATVIDFFPGYGISKPCPRLVAVDELLKDNQSLGSNEPLRDSEPLKSDEPLKGDETLKVKEPLKNGEPLKGEELLKGDETLKGDEPPKDQGNTSPSFTWVHLPANNVSDSILAIIFELNLAR